MRSTLEGHRFVFVAGLHRSGTTLLARLLAAHAEISGFSGTGAPADEGQHLQSVYPSDHEYGRPGRFGFAPEMHLTESSPLASKRSAKRLFDEWSPHWDLSRPWLLEKSPPNLLKTRFLQALYPNSAFIVVVRHPIPVSIPTAKWRGTRRYDRLLEHWVRCHALFDADCHHLNRVHVLKYEDLVRDPAGVLRRIFQFLELEPIPPSEPVASGANEKYFRRWQELKRSDPRMRAYLDLVSLWYERRARLYGYSLLFPKRDASRPGRAAAAREAGLSGDPPQRVPRLGVLGSSLASSRSSFMRYAALPFMLAVLAVVAAALVGSLDLSSARSYRGCLHLSHISGACHAPSRGSWQIPSAFTIAAIGLGAAVAVRKRA